MMLNEITSKAVITSDANASAAAKAAAPAKPPGAAIKVANLAPVAAYAV